MRQRKMENYSMQELVAAFSNKWNIPVYNDGDKIKSLPCIMAYETESTRGKYIILFKNTLSANPHKDVLTKDKLIHPDKHFAQFKLAQLGVEDGIKTAGNSA